MIGTYIRTARESKGMLLRELAAELDIDTAMLSKMERGVRSFRKVDLFLLSKVLNKNNDELYTMWLADKALKACDDDKFKVKALEMALTNCKNN